MARGFDGPGFDQGLNVGEHGLGDAHGDRDFYVGPGAVHAFAGVDCRGLVDEGFGAAVDGRFGGFASAISLPFPVQIDSFRFQKNSF